jgi:hypothetical protein
MQFAHDTKDSRGPDGLTGSERYIAYGRFVEAARSAGTDASFAAFQRSLQRGAAPPAADDCACRASTDKELTGAELYAHRLTNGGKNPTTFRDHRGRELTGQEIYEYRLTHAGKNPPVAR